jgi:hypothetical protein
MVHFLRRARIKREPRARVVGGRIVAGWWQIRSTLVLRDS